MCLFVATTMLKRAFSRPPSLDTFMVLFLLLSFLQTMETQVQVRQNIKLPLEERRLWNFSPKFACFFAHFFHSFKLSEGRRLLGWVKKMKGFSNKQTNTTAKQQHLPDTDDSAVPPEGEAAGGGRRGEGGVVTEGDRARVVDAVNPQALQHRSVRLKP